MATGINWAFTQEDSWITSYRCHCVALIRGGSVAKVVGELFGNMEGYTKGKGGSMHFYNKDWNFFGGQGIVGAQVPVAAGLAFANKYKAAPGEKMNVAIACYGDGAANQGQIREAANMSALWKLVCVLVVIIKWPFLCSTTTTNSHVCTTHSTFFGFGLANDLLHREQPVRHGNLH